MTYTRHRALVPESIALPSDPEDESREGDPITVEFDWLPGTSATGFSGPPENYDPGEDDEFVIISGDDDHLCEEAIAEWLDDHWERPEPDPDYGRDDE